MQVTAVAYHTVHNRVYLGKICMSWDCEADTFYIMLRVQKEHLLKTVVYGSFEWMCTLLNTWPWTAVRNTSWSQIFFWLTLLPLKWLQCLHWPKIKSGLNSIFCVSTDILQDEWAAIHISHICVFTANLLVKPSLVHALEKWGSSASPYLKMVLHLVKESDFN